VEKKHKSLIALSASLLIAPAATADVIWDNYQGQDGYDHVTALSSERATLISDTWLVDDVVFESPVILEQIQWLGLRDQQSFSGADYIVMDGDFNVIAEVHDLAFGSQFLTNEFGLQVYEGTVETTPLQLEPGQYYMGARLVDGFLGRNFVLTSGTGAQNVLGQTQAYFKGVPFGADDWTPVEDILDSHVPSDFAYRISGQIVPEPASLLLLLGGAAMLRRRTH
jgi:hypothetical protein